MIVAGIVCLFVGGFLGVFAMGLVSGGAYEKGYEDGRSGR
jgi:hypothetical protein